MNAVGSWFVYTPEPVTFGSLAASLLLAVRTRVSGRIMAHLSLLDENGLAAQRWELGSRPLAVGRGESADVSVEDQALSRRHFLIVRDADGFLLQDLESQNGTWVDGCRAQTTRLHDHDCILAGRSLFMFSSGASAQPAHASSLSSI